MDTSLKYYNDFLQGNNDALGELVNIYNHNLILFVNGYVKNIACAEDIVANTFVELLIRKSKFKENAHFKTWLFKVARNNAIDYLRKNEKTFNLELDENFRDEKCIENEVLKKEQDKELHKALEKLKSEYKEVLYLEYFENMSYNEIAKVMKKTEKQIKNLVYRAKISLKEKLIKEDFLYEKF